MLNVREACAVTAGTIRDTEWWLESHLSNWVRWMRGSEAPEGLPDRACGGVRGFTILGDSEQAYDKMDATLAEATNAAIEGLVPAERAAIYREYGVCAVYRFPRDNYQDILAAGRQHVLESLRRRGVWCG